MLIETTEMEQLAETLKEERIARLELERHLADIHEHLRMGRHDSKNMLACLKMSVHLLQRDRSLATPERLEAMDRQVDALIALLESLINTSQPTPCEQ